MINTYFDFSRINE